MTAERQKRSPSIDFHDGDLHCHACPKCYEHAPCRMDCQIEQDLSEERPHGAHADCDDCCSAEERAFRMICNAESAEAAQDRLHSERVYPWAPGDEDAPVWLCRACRGSGVRSWSLRRENSLPCDACAVETGQGQTSPGATVFADLHSDLAVVSSLGPGDLKRVYELAKIITAASKQPNAIVTWVVGDREDFEKDRSNRESFIAEMFKREERRLYGVKWPRGCEYGGQFGTPENDHHGVHAAYQAVRSLAVGDEDEPKRTKVHLVDIFDDMIVIGIERNER